MENSHFVLFYKSFYNYFLKKDGYSRILPFIASSACALCYVFIIGTCLSLIYIFTDIRIRLSMHKSISFIASFLFFYVVYLIHMRMFKFPREGDKSDHSFSISNRSYHLSIKVFFGSFFLFYSTLIIMIIFTN